MSPAERLAIREGGLVRQGGRLLERTPAPEPDYVEATIPAALTIRGYRMYRRSSLAPARKKT